MILHFNTQKKKKSRGIGMLVSKAWEIGGILFYT